MTNKFVILTAAALIMGRPIQAQLNPGCAVQPASLRSMRDCYRPLLVFAPSARDASLMAQQAVLDQYADDMMDRNLLYVPVLVQNAHFNAPLHAPYVLLRQPKMSAIRARYQIGPSEFVVVLVGKDGGEKFRAKKPVSVLRLDRIVDAMPMGRQEKAARSANSD
jgi:hypothetical protein